MKKFLAAALLVVLFAAPAFAAKHKTKPAVAAKHTHHLKLHKKHFAKFHRTRKP